MQKIIAKLKGLSTGTKVGLVILTFVLLGGFASASNNPRSDVAGSTDKGVKGASSTIAVTPKIEKKPIAETEEVPFSTKEVQDPSLSQGTKVTRNEGKNGIRTKTYEVTFTDGTETGRTLISDEVTTQPVDKTISIGTKVVLNCEDGTYINSAGNEVCRPAYSNSAPAGATAKCRDGTYSFSQSRSGTCSHHGGVAVWL